MFEFIKKKKLRILYLSPLSLHQLLGRLHVGVDVLHSDKHEEGEEEDEEEDEDGDEGEEKELEGHLEKEGNDVRCSSFRWGQWGGGGLRR